MSTSDSEGALCKGQAYFSLALRVRVGTGFGLAFAGHCPAGGKGEVNWVIVLVCVALGAYAKLCGRFSATQAGVFGLLLPMLLSQAFADTVAA